MHVQMECALAKHASFASICYATAPLLSLVIMPWPLAIIVSPVRAHNHRVPHPLSHMHIYTVSHTFL